MTLGHVAAPCRNLSVKNDSWAMRQYLLCAHIAYMGQAWHMSNRSHLYCRIAAPGPVL